MFKIRDEVVCIDDNVDYGYLNFATHPGITYGKIYMVVESFPLWDGVSVITDDGQCRSHFASRFVSQETFRTIKLSKICSKLEK